MATWILKFAKNPVEKDHPRMAALSRSQNLKGGRDYTPRGDWGGGLWPAHSIYSNNKGTFMFFFFLQ